MKSSPWFEKYPALFEREREQLEARGYLMDRFVFARERRVAFSGSSNADPTRRLHIEFPHGYPSFPPSIRDDSTIAPLARHHNAATRQICLFGPGSGRWYSKLTAIDALDEAEDVLASTRPLSGPSDGDAPEPLTTQLRYAPGVAILVPPPLSEAALSEAHILGHFELKMEPLEAGKFCRGVVRKLEAGNESFVCDPYHEQLVGGHRRYGDVVLLPAGAREQDIRQYARDAAEKTKPKRRKDENWVAFRLKEEAQRTTQTRLAWVIGRYNRAGELELYRTFTHREDERQARIPGLMDLGSKKVMLVGCGCLGSRMAVALAASGIGGIELLDRDVVDPYNSVRHELGIDYFGVSKAAGLACRLKTINPLLARNGALRAWTCTLGTSVPAQQEEELLAAVASCDLVIDTTGAHHLSRWLNEVCQDLRVPTLYASVTNGAWSGEIVRVIPGATGCWLCWMDQYYDSRPAAEPIAPGGFFAPGCDQPSFTGTGYESAVVANLAVMMAIETLLQGKRPGRDFAADYICWHGRSDDGAPLLSAKFLPVSADPECTLHCGPA